jgi:hypothetical protein
MKARRKRKKDFRMKIVNTSKEKQKGGNIASKTFIKMALVVSLFEL